jgi:hypothetical protein
MALTETPANRWTPAAVRGGGGTRLRRVLLRWQAPQPCRPAPGATVAEAVDPTLVGTRTLRGPPAYPSVARYRSLLAMPPSGEWSGPRRAVRFARLIHRRVRDLGGPTARAAYGGNLTLPGCYSE